MVYVDPETLRKARTKLQQRGRVGVKDAGYILGLHYTTVSNYIDQDKIATIIISNRHYISHKELNRFIDEYNEQRKDTHDFR